MDKGEEEGDLEALAVWSEEVLAVLLKLSLSL